MQKFMVGAGLAGGPPAQRTPPPAPEVLEAFGRMQGNVNYFLAHGFKPISRYTPDVSTLKTGPARIIVGVGENTVGSLPHRSAVALAEHLGTAAVSFPGGHGGYSHNPAAFAEQLDEAFRGSHASQNP
jgi:pimeloyl-ACP methyl ester carboxylesterase